MREAEAFYAFNDQFLYDSVLSEASHPNPGPIVTTPFHYQALIKSKDSVEVCSWLNSHTPSILFQDSPCLIVHSVEDQRLVPKVVASINDSINR